MSYFNIVAATTENTVVTEYIPEPRTAEGYQSEAALSVSLFAVWVSWAMSI